MRRVSGGFWSTLTLVMAAAVTMLAAALAGATKAEADVTVPTTIPGESTSDSGAPELPPDRGGTSMENPVPPFYPEDLPEGLRPKPAPSEHFAGQPDFRVFRIPVDGQLVEVRVADGQVDQRLVGDAAAIQATNKYQTDLVAPADFTNNVEPVYNVDHFVWIATRGCTDPETCSGGVRKSSGYTWFVPITVELGDNLAENEYGIHGGLALGGSGQKNKWYVDWSGYYGPDHPLNGDPLPGSPKQKYLNLAEQHWYRLRVWRVSCSGSGNYGWLLAVKDLTAGTAEVQVGTYCVNADTISEAYYFAEIIEPDPCDTDFWGTHSYLIQYRDGSGGPYTFSRGTGIYVDNTCGVPPSGNTNLRSPNPSIEYTIDERETARGSNGGITQNGQQLWP